MDAVLVDTNVLLHYPQVFQDYKDALIIHISVIEELDRLKDCNNPYIVNKAYRAIKLIMQNEDTIQFYLDMPLEANQEPDDILIYVANKYGYQLLSNDLPVILKARLFNVDCINYYKTEQVYTGIYYLDIPLDDNQYNVEMEHLLKSKKAPHDMSENEFLIIRNTNDTYIGRDGTIIPNVIYIMQYRAGQLEIVATPKSSDAVIQNSFITKISPRNAEQQCLFNLLNNQNVTIVSASGTFGTGKSYILLNYALQALEKGDINKIVYVPNNSFSRDSREIAAVPGNVLEKEMMHMGTLIDIVGIDKINSLTTAEELEITPISIMRGRDIKKAILYVNEAQNLTEDHVQLLIGRCGDGTRIFFDGDIKQTDAVKFKERSGLRQLTELRKSKTFAPLFGCVKLNMVERSKTAMAAAYLNELDFF